ncbi:hypothetical protein QLG25_17985 [Pseudomonas sp. CBR-F]
MSNFHILPKQKSGRAELGTDVKIWYVMEGGFEHFRCSNPTEANELLEGIKKHQSTEIQRKELLEAPVLYKWSQEGRVAVMGVVARQVAVSRGLKIVKDEVMLPKYDPSVASPKLPTTPDVQTDAANLSATTSKIIKLEQP